MGPLHTYIRDRKRSQLVRTVDGGKLSAGKKNLKCFFLRIVGLLKDRNPPLNQFKEGTQNS